MAFEMVLCDGFLDPAHQPLSLSPKMLDHRLSLVSPHRFQGSSEAVPLCAMSRRKEEDPLPVVIDAAQSHQLALSDQGRDCKAISQGLSEAREVGDDLVVALSARV